jgi:hypothetical protein
MKDAVIKTTDKLKEKVALLEELAELKQQIEVKKNADPKINPFDAIFDANKVAIGQIGEET